jgi:integrase
MNMAVIKRGKEYYIQYSIYKIVEGKKVRIRKQEKVGPSRELAQAALQKRQLEKSERKFFGKKVSKKMLLGDFLGEYLSYSKTNKKTSMYERDSFSAGHLEPALGTLYLDEITPVAVEEYKAVRLDQVSPTTVNREIEFLRALLNKAVEWEILAVSPIRKMPFMKEPPARVRYLLILELLALLAQCSARIKPVVIVAVHTGMRKGEILGLEWRDIDFDQGIIHVERSFHRGRIDTTKGNSRRDIPLAAEVRQALEALPRLNEKVFPDIIEFKNAYARAGIKV